MKRDRIDTLRGKQLPVTKKAQILALYQSGVTDVEVIARLTGAQPSYVGSVLKGAGLLDHYFDLYTSTAYPMNTYSQWFAGKLGYRNEETARKGVALIEERYRQFQQARDRTGQHHAMLMALTMFNRARWRGKRAEAAYFRQWLEQVMNEREEIEELSASDKG